MEEDDNHCAVCISKLQNEVYVPCSNEHKYHRKCLFEWAKTDYTCPMCREQFSEIRVLRENDVIRTVKPPRQIKKRKDELANAEYDAPYSNMACEICHGMTNEEHMLVCDVCDLGYHIYCVNPPLDAVPRGRWECRRCILELSPADFIDDSTTVNEYSSNLEDGEQDDDTLSDESNENEGVDRFSKEDGDILGNEQLEDPNVPSSSRSIITMRELQKKRKRKKHTSSAKKSKRSSKRKSKDGKKSSKRRHKRRRKKGKGRKSKEDHRPRSMHERIADVCGIDLRHSDAYKVVKRNSRGGGGGGGGGASSSKALSSKLDLLGNAWIPPPDDSSGDELPTMPVERKSSPLRTSSLLDEIIANQSRILAPSRLLKVNRDGTLVETDAYRDYLLKKKSTTKRSEKKPREQEDGKPEKEKNDMPKVHSADTLSNRGNDHMVILSACNNVEKAPLLDKSINIIQPPSSVEKAKNCGGDAAAISRQTDKRFAAEKRSVSPDATRPADNTVRNSNPLLNNSERTAKPTVLMQQPSTSTSGNFVASVPSPFSNLSSDAQNAANVQHLFGGNPIIQNILHGATLPPSPSTCGVPTTSSTMAAAAIAAAAFNATSKGFMPSAAAVNAANMLEFFNHANATSSSSGNNLMATANLLNASQRQSRLANLSNGIGLPQQQNNNGAVMEMLNRLISQQQQQQQQQQQAAVAAAFGFSSNHPLLFGAQPPGSSSSVAQHQLQSALMAPPSIPSSTSVMAGLLPPPPQIITSANGNVSSNGLMGLMPPPPPPTGQSPTSVQLNGARYGFNSPMDIEDDGEANTSSFNTSKLSSKSSKSDGNRKHSSCRKSDNGEQRSETVKLADAAMKNALKPYFTKRMISKDEYKEIMKKGVAKLRNKEELKPDKVDRFVRQYVDLIAKRRKK